MEFSDTNKQTRESSALLFGIFLVFGIGIWWFWHTLQSGKESNADISEKESSVDDFLSIGTDELKDIVLDSQKNADVIIVDARPTSLWSEGHILGSVSLMPEDARADFHPSAEEKAKRWLIVSSDRESAAALAAILQDRGIARDRISLYEGTYETWANSTGLVTANADPSSPLDVTKVNFLSPEDAKARIDRGGRWFLLDVRSPSLFQEEHVFGATNIPLASLERDRSKIPATASILVYGESDRESFSAGVKLFDLGFFNTFTLSTGFDEWKNKKLPTERK